MMRFLRACTLVLCGLTITSCSVFSTHTDLHQEMIQGTAIKYIRTKSWIWELFGNGLHTAIGDTLYVDDDEWELFSSGSRCDRAIIVHENVHAIRQIEAGVWGWVCSYIFDRKFRLAEEQIAIEAEWRYRIQDGERFTKRDWHYLCNSEAMSMSRDAYSMISYEDAYKWMNELFTKLYKEAGLAIPK